MSLHSQIANVDSRSVMGEHHNDRRQTGRYTIEPVVVNSCLFPQCFARAYFSAVQNLLLGTVKQLSGARVGLHKMFVLSSLVAQVGYSVERHEFKPRPKRYILSVLFSVCSSTFIFIFHQLVSGQAMEMGREIKTSHCLKKQKTFYKIFGNIKNHTLSLVPTEAKHTHHLLTTIVITLS